MYFRKTTKEDLLTILKIYQSAICFMRDNGNMEQWNDFDSLRSNVVSDIHEGTSYVLVDGEEIEAVFSLHEGIEPSYLSIDGKWHHDSPYTTIHRVAVNKKHKGYGMACIAFGMLQSSHIRIDTHETNKSMRSLIEKNGFEYCGIITLSDKTKRVAFEKTVSFSDKLLSWYLLNHRDLPWRKDHDFYHVYLSEVMLQQTKVESVKGYYERFLSALPSLKDLADAKEDVYLKLWQGLGYYSRVKNLAKGAKYIVSNYGDSYPRTLEELLLVPGIGEYTAKAILSISYDERYIAVDGNLLRVFSRLTCYGKDIHSVQAKKDCEKYFLDLLKEKPSFFNQALMDLGEMVCSPHGEIHCDICPLKESCKSFASGVADKYPKKSSPIKKKEVMMTVFLLSYQDRYVIRKRKDEGLLSSLYEFWNVKGYLKKEEVNAYLEKEGFNVSSIKELPDSRHVFTHLIWNMKGYEVMLTQIPQNEEYILATKDEIQNRYSIPSAFHLCLDIIGKTNK